MTVIGGTVDYLGKQYRVIFNKKNKKKILEKFRISEYTYKGFFVETGNKEEISLVRQNPDGIYMRLKFNYNDEYKLLESE